MDTPRRLQLASTATAIAGLGMGAILLGRPSTEAVATIDLDTVVATVRETDQPVRTERAPEIVRPRVIEDVPSTGSKDGPVSREDAAPGSSTDRTDPDDSPDSEDSEDSDDSPDSDDSDDSPDSVDSPSSNDSD